MRRKHSILSKKHLGEGDFRLDKDKLAQALSTERRRRAVDDEDDDDLWGKKRRK